MLVIREFGTDRRFRPWKWGLALASGLATAILPGPLWSAAAHGMGNTPGQGVLAILMMMAGIVATVALGIVWGPGEHVQEYRKEEQ